MSKQEYFTAAAAKSLQSCPTLCKVDSPPGFPVLPWDSPGKNTAVGCHFLLQCMKVKSESEGAQSCLTLSDLLDCSLPGFSVHGIFQARVLWGLPNAEQDGYKYKFFHKGLHSEEQVGFHSCTFNLHM